MCNKKINTDNIISVKRDKVKYLGGGSEFVNIADKVIIIHNTFDFNDGSITLGKECKNG